ncbi:alpha/beta hydrolase [Clostridium sardiniense]|uniref:alpha/beta hydrolase n=1 Tax=Clostridium sardiniense TaxID=29369 RepID=UPI003D340322
MILRGNVFSKILGMDTGITVIVPNKFKESDKYKVAYLLHGLCGDNGSWADNTMLPVYANNYNTIFIMPEVARSFYTDMKYGQKFFSYVTEELPEICKRVFNISNKREDTVIIGGSMGGYGALKCALSEPEKYGYCCAFSSACLFLKEYLDIQRESGKTEEFRSMYGEQLITDFLSAFGPELEWNPKDEILELAKSVSVQEIKPKIYLACGTEDYLRDYNIRFCNEIEKINLNFTYEEWEGIHDWYFFDEALKKSLQICFGN